MALRDLLAPRGRDPARVGAALLAAALLPLSVLALGGAIAPSTEISAHHLHAPPVTSPLTEVRAAADQRPVLPSCGPNASVRCSGPGGTPSYCDHASAQPMVTVRGDVRGRASGVWCVYGEGIPSDPASYRGLVRFTPGARAVHATYLAGRITVDSPGLRVTSFGAAAAPRLLFYAASGPVRISAGVHWRGDVLAARSTIAVQGPATATTRLQAEHVVLTGAGIVLHGEGTAVPVGQRPG